MKRIKLLADLKPALDGYAGIPQESRLLFRGLRTLADELEVDGLLQHGSRTLATGSDVGTLPPHEQVIRLSRTVVSFYRNPKMGFPAWVLKAIARYLELQRLRWQALQRTPVRMGRFETDLFDDFIWSRIFEKTLQSADKELVTSACYRIIPPSRRAMHEVGLKGLLPYQNPRFLSLDTSGYDYLLAQTPFPVRVSTGTKLVVRYHDAVPVLLPHTIGDKSFHQATHYRALKDNVEAGALFSCISEASRVDLLKMFPEVEPRTSVIHNMVSEDYYVDDSQKSQVQNIIHSHKDEGKVHKARQEQPLREGDESDYLLVVSTIEPRKNHKLLISAWERLINTTMPNLKLVVVGNKGWECESIIDRFCPWIKRGELFHLTNVTASELRMLYRHAAATICPSLSEGFDYSGIEAMRCGGVVVASDIPVHREIFGHAATYFDPYSVDDAAEVMARVLGEDGVIEREAMVSATKGVLERYTTPHILSQWRTFFANHAQK